MNVVIRTCRRTAELKGVIARVNLTELEDVIRPLLHPSNRRGGWEVDLLGPSVEVDGHGDPPAPMDVNATTVADARLVKLQREVAWRIRVLESNFVPGIVGRRDSGRLRSAHQVGNRRFRGQLDQNHFRNALSLQEDLDLLRIAHSAPHPVAMTGPSTGSIE
jgi:hypothetical protein